MFETVLLSCYAIPQSLGCCYFSRKFMCYPTLTQNQHFFIKGTFVAITWTSHFLTLLSLSVCLSVRPFALLAHRSHIDLALSLHHLSSFRQIQYTGDNHTFSPSQFWKIALKGIQWQDCGWSGFSELNGSSGGHLFEATKMVHQILISNAAMPNTNGSYISQRNVELLLTAPRWLAS